MTIIHEKMYIDGQWVEGQGQKIQVFNPARSELIGDVPYALPEEVEKALKSAKRAFPEWSGLPPIQRANFLKKIATLLAERSHQIGRLMTSEQGKPVNEAVAEIQKLADTFTFYAEEATRVSGEIIANDSNDFQSLVVKEPIGVVAAISPWNYPAELIGWKVAAALAAGCTIVVKPPELTPLSPLAIIGCLHEANLPAGVVNMITGPGSSVGQAMVESPLVDKIAFTGSSQVGLRIQQSATDIKRMSLELGGSCPMVVTTSANLDDAVKGAVRRSFRNCGQICIAINRIYVACDIYQTFLQKLATATDALVVDDGLDNPSADLGAICSQEVLDKTLQHLQDGLDKGANLVCGGSPPHGEKFKKGRFFRPTVLADCNHSMKVMTEETFGPLVGVSKYENLEEAVKMANDSPFGLAAYAYTKNLDEMRFLTQHLHCGNVAVNTVDAGIINAPYGGWKQSGVGVEHGREGLLEYLNLKHIRIRFN